MKCIGWWWLAASSLLLASVWLTVLISTATASSRPEYGGSLRVVIREAPASLDPSDDSQPDSLAPRNLLSMIFETLVTVDDRGRTHPGLATTWEVAPGNQRWQLTLRSGVRVHDGTALTAEIAASSLRVANPSWKVFAEGSSVIVERDQSDANLLAELALARNSIVKKSSGKLSGTGPFHIKDWQPGKHLTLAAEENHWRGRPFLNVIEVEMGKNFREQLIELESGEADLIEVSPEQGHRVTMEGRHVTSSEPLELVALVFNRDAQTPADKLLRRALAHSIDRVSMRSVLLQGAGQPSASLLPNWMSGYAFTFPNDANLSLARHERDQAKGISWTLGYDANDTVMHMLAERVALNARDAGLLVQPTGASTVDIRLVRIPIASPDPRVALASLSEVFGITMPKLAGDSDEDLYDAERALLETQRVIPLFDLPAEWASSSALRDWAPGADGNWRLDEVWIGKDNP